MHRCSSYKLSKYIASMISSLAGKTSSHVLNSKLFAGMMQEDHAKEDEVLVSFDVTSLLSIENFSLTGRHSEHHGERCIISTRLSNVIIGVTNNHRQRKRGGERGLEPLLSNMGVLSLRMYYNMLLICLMHHNKNNFRATLWGQKFLGYHALTTPGLDG